MKEDLRERYIFKEHHEIPLLDGTVEALKKLGENIKIVPISPSGSDSLKDPYIQAKLAYLRYYGLEGIHLARDIYPFEILSDKNKSYLLEELASSCEYTVLQILLLSREHPLKIDNAIFDRFCKLVKRSQWNGNTKDRVYGECLVAHSVQQIQSRREYKAQLRATIMSDMIGRLSIIDCALLGLDTLVTVCDSSYSRWQCDRYATLLQQLGRLEEREYGDLLIPAAKRVLSR